jgi:hypothetical protein
MPEEIVIVHGRILYSIVLPPLAGGSLEGGGFHLHLSRFNRDSHQGREILWEITRLTIPLCRISCKISRTGLDNLLLVL